MDTNADMRPAYDQKLVLGAITFGSILLAIYLTQSIIQNETGGISAMVRTIRFPRRQSSGSRLR